MRELPPLFDIDSLRRFEAAAIVAAGEPGALMERAGQAGWQHVLDRWPSAMRLLVVCGSGGNGGDGLVLARLAHQSGREVTVVDAAPHRRTGPAAVGAYRALVDAGGRVVAPGEPWPEADVIVDALLGIGIDGPPWLDAIDLIERMNRHSAPVLALDVPSGVGATGLLGPAVRAAATLEFLLPKAALRTGPALECVGRLDCAGLDVPAALARPAPCARLASADALSAWLRPRRLDAHKGENGRVACVGGEHGSGGAIVLCAEGALRAGAGLVRVHTRDVHLAPLLARLPEAMVVPENAGFDPDGATAVVIGPGLGQGNWGFAHLHRLIEAALPAVLDADALNLLARHHLDAAPDAVLTPHPGEAARLLDTTIANVQQDRLGAASLIASRHRAVVVLKGAGTVIAAPGRTSCVLDAGNPGMSTGGMGDVLAGVIGALRAQGLDAFDAACAGALLHSAAGDLAAEAGERGLLPTDLMAPIRALANPA